MARGAALTGYSGARVLVQRLAVLLERGMHGRHLGIFARKTAQRILELGRGISPQFPRFDHLGFAVGARRALAEAHRHPIGLVGFQELRTELGRFAETDGQQSGGQRIQRSGVSRLAGIEQPLDARHGARGTQVQGLVEQQNAVDVGRHQT